MTNDGSHTYTYNGDNQLTAVDWGGASGVAYAFDDQNRRIKKYFSATGTWTHSVWEGDQVIAEYSHTGAVSATYFYAGSRMIRNDSGGVGTRTYLSDRLSMRMSLDFYGNVVGRQGHLPFGEEIGTSGELDKHRFTSYERDNESGTDYAINRQYAQTVSRFMQADPYRNSGGVGDPQSWNRYRYSRNDPVNFVDPIGLFESPCSNCVPYNQGCQMFPELCFPHPRAPFEDGGGGGGETQTPWWTGFDAEKIRTLNAAFSLAFGLLNNRECSGGLAAKNIDVAGVQRIILTAVVKPLSADPDEHGQWRVFNGQTSGRPGVMANLSRRGIPAAVFPDDATGMLEKGDIFIYPLFFDTRGGTPIGPTLSQAIVLIHEAVHLTGKRDRNFGRNQEEGSHNLTNLIIHSCFNRNFTYRDLAFNQEIR